MTDQERIAELEEALRAARAERDEQTRRIRQLEAAIEEVDARMTRLPAAAPEPGLGEVVALYQMLPGTWHRALAVARAALAAPGASGQATETQP